MSHTNPGLFEGVAVSVPAGGKRARTDALELTDNADEEITKIKKENHELKTKIDEEGFLTCANTAIS